MATKSLTIEILGDSKSAEKAFRDTDQAQDSFGKKLGGLAGRIGALAAGAGLLKFGKDSVEAFKESEGASNKLSDAFARFPQMADSNVAAFEKMAEARAKVTRFDDDATKAGQAALAQFGLTGKQVLELTPLIQDYAAKTGKSLPDAADAVGKAMLGKGKALAEIGIKFKDTGSLAGNFEQTVAGLRTQVGGFAEKEGSTAAGKTEIMKNQFGELQELVGSKLVPVITSLTGVITNVVGWFTNLSPGIQKVITVGIGLVALVATIVKVTQMWTTVQAALNVVMALNPVVLVVLAIVALVAIVVVAYQKVDWFRAFVDGAFRMIGNVIAGVVEWVKNNWPLLLAILTGPIGVAVLLITKNWDTIKAGFSAVVEWIAARANDVVTFFAGLPARISAAVSGMWNGIKDGFRAAVNFIIRGWNNLEFRVPGFKIGPVGFDGFTLGVPDIPYLARGGTAISGGAAIVGENGPELLNMPRGASVIPLPRAVGGGQTINITLNAHGVNDPDALVRIMAPKIQTAIRRETRRSGGQGFEDPFAR